jgi:hypothetical protein
VVAQLHADSPQHQQPQHNHQRQIKARERRRVEQRKGKIERTAARQQPHLVAVPHRANAGQRGPPLGFVADQEQVQHTDAQVEAVQHHIADDHHGNQPEPDETHHDKTPTGANPE